jgi:hypothetical protein
MDNSFDRIVEMFEDSGADSVMIEPSSHPEMVIRSPYNSKTGECWYGMGMISSLEEAKACKYPTYTNNGQSPQQ